MTQILSIKQIRDRLADVVAGVEARGDEVIITKFGKPKAILMPIPKTRWANMGSFDEVFGTWKERKDIKDSGKWVKNLRVKMSFRKKDE